MRKAVFSQTPGLRKWLRIGILLSLTLVLLLAACGHRGKKDNGLLMLLSLVPGNGAGCSNTSGLVICIPPGFRF